MTAPASITEFLEIVAKSEIVSPSELEALSNLPTEPKACAAALIAKGLITKYQAKHLLEGRYKGFRLGAYVIREQIGQGGMGAVFLAEHETLKRRVALKVLPLKKNGDNELSIERFLREARSAAALDHPNIVRLHDVGKSGTTHYLVMEYIEGQTLDQFISGGGTLSASRAVEYIAQAAAGLQHAHERGFVHRDIKPSNLILAKDGTIKILDMGLARRTDDADEKLTEVMDKGAVVGTADYISPEQAMNAELDVRSDIYSLGATFFALVTGQPPFTGNTTQKLIQHQLKAAPSVTTLDRTFPPGLSAIVAKMLAKKPADRFATPAELIKALAEWLPQQAGARLQASMTNTKLAQSEDMRTTLSEVTSGTMRLGSSPRLNEPVAAPKRKWLLPAIAAGVLALGAAVAVVAFTGGPASSGTAPVQADKYVTTEKPPSTASTIPRPAPPKSVPKPPPRALLYQPDTSRQKAFIERGHNSVAGTGARKWVVDEKVGDGELPAGWVMTTVKPGTIAETAVKFIDGQPVIGYKCAGGTPSLWLKTGTFTARTGKLLASFEYSTADPGTVPLFRFTQETPVRKLAGEVKNLRATAEGEWLPVSKEFEIAAGNAGWFEFHLAGKGTDYVWIRNFKLHQGGNPADTPSHDVPLYSVEFSRLATGKERFENTTRSFDQYSIGGKDMLSSMYIHSHKNKITSEYTIADIDGVRALGLQQFEGSAGTQVHFTLNDAQSYLKAGETITIRIVYRFDGTGSGATCMERRSDRKMKNGRWLLTPTNGQWQTLEFPFIRPAHDDPYDLIINAGNSEMEPRAEGVIWIKSVEARFSSAK